MIKINDIEIKIERFPDGTQRLLNMPDIGKNHEIVFDWRYESDTEAMSLSFMVSHYRNLDCVGDFILFMPYLPNARMDRTHRDTELFTLKWFCEFINGLKFNKVYILDPHSNVSPALLNHVKIIHATKCVHDVMKMINCNDIILYYPDFGACKKYSELFPNIPYCFGKKIRDWDTGKILGLTIENERNLDLTDKTILMVDDIIAYGGSMYYSAKELKKLGAGKIYAYASHTENSILDENYGTLRKALEDGTVEQLFTTNSLFTGEHPKITVLDVAI